MMMAMSVQCQTCGVFIYKGTKFNMRKEDILGETYLGIQVFRFYFRCPKCAAEITFKTDPKGADYIVEHGATRTAEPFRLQAQAERDFKQQREEEEEGDAMKVRSLSYPFLSFFLSSSKPSIYLFLLHCLGSSPHLVALSYLLPLTIVTSTSISTLVS